jgi:UDP-GlcNAc:undecaprenyl-phosphate GlcNAc-1-phosphate transferase
MRDLLFPQIHRNTLFASLIATVTVLQCSYIFDAESSPTIVSAHPAIIIYLFLFVIAFLLVIVVTPVTVILAKRIGAVDYPEARKVHTAPIPRLGGLAIAFSILLTISLGYLRNPYLKNGLPSVAGIVPGLLMILAMGVYDDVRNASPLAKLTVQIAAAAIAAAFGIKFQLASNPLAHQMLDYFDLGRLSLPLTIVWIVGLTNAFNLIDGLDGLASGIAMFSSIALFLISLQQGAGLVTYFYATIAGATLAFLKFARHPATVFMGDSGATFLGFLLACLSVTGTQKSYTVAAFFIPIIVFGVPLFDATVTLIRRYLNRGRMFGADRDHIHHRLLAWGLNQRQVVLILYIISIFLGIIAFAFTVMLDQYAAVIVGIIGLLGGFIAKELNVFGTSRARMERAFRYERQIQERETNRAEANEPAK